VKGDVMLVIEIKDTSGNVLGVLTTTPAKFGTGSTGLRANGKILVDGARHQVNINIVKIGSKPEKKSNK
jgi:hypothetical protein